MIIKINDDRELEIKTLYSGYLEENNSLTLEFEIPEYLEKYNKKLNFLLHDGTTVCKLFDDINSNKFTFTRDLLKFNKLQMAIEFFDTEENLIYRTSILTIIISDSIICDDDVSPEDSKVVILNELIQKVNDLNTEVTESESVRESNEETRVSNENTRINNENAREEYITQLKKDIESGNLYGATFIPSVSADGDISWTNNKNLDNPETVNIKGPKGDTGETGKTGEIGTLLVVSSISEMVDTQRNYLNISDGHWYYYNENTWKDGGLYQAIGISDASVTPRKTSFYKKTVNIRDVDIENIGKGIDNNTGDIFDVSSLRCSNFIKINDAKTIGIKVFQNNSHATFIRLFFYDIDKSFISTTELSFPNNNTMEIPTNASYVRYQMNNMCADRIITITMPYTELADYLEPYILENIEEQLINIKNGSNLDNGAIKPIKTDFFNIIQNLIDKSKMEEGAILGFNGVLDTSFTDYNATQYIPVKKGKSYFFSDNENIIPYFTGALYNKYKIYLKQINDTNPFIPEEDGYCRLSTTLSIEKLQLQTDKITSYIEYNNPLATLKGELLPNINDYIYNYKNKRVLILGDSITALDMGDTGWVKYFSDIVEPDVKVNVAVAGATWKDKVVNQAYDGNPQPSTEGNVIGNQVQKVINEKNSNNNDYKDFDIIIIAAGTNDTPAEEIDTVENEFISNYNTNNYTVVPLENVNRMTFAGAMRYTYEKLNELYPNAKIVVCTPLQECFESYDSIYKKGKLIEYIASRLSIISWNTRDCGILNIYEKPNTDSRDLVDGLHPNASGAKKIAEYISREFKKLFV